MKDYELVQLMNWSLPSKGFKLVKKVVVLMYGRPSLFKVFGPVHSDKMRRFHMFAVNSGKCC